jgi:hypothetical protein
MVVFSANERLGLSDPGGDFFKYKYIQVGAYCDGFVAFLASVGYLLSVYLKSCQSSSLKPYAPSWESLFALFIIEFALILQGIIVVPGTWGMVWMLSMIGYLAVALAAALAGTFAEGEYARRKKIIIGILIVFASLTTYGCFAGGGYCGKLWPSSWWLWGPPDAAGEKTSNHYWLVERWVARVVLCFLCLFLGRLIYLLQQCFSPAAPVQRCYSAHAKQVTAQASVQSWFWYVTLVPLMIFATFDAIIGFAAVIYPYIPVAKAGADFTNASIVDILPADPSKQKKMSRYVILLETSDYLYVASDTKYRPDWGKLGSRPIPVIQRIPLGDVGGVVYQPWDTIHRADQQAAAQP